MLSSNNSKRDYNTTHLSLSLSLFLIPLFSRLHITCISSFLLRGNKTEIDTFHSSSNARRAKRSHHAKNPSLPPLAFAVLISFCRCFVVAPNSEQKSPITCECKEIALPLNWLNRFTPMIGLMATTSGANTPPSLTFPMDTIFKALLFPAGFL